MCAGKFRTFLQRTPLGDSDLAKKHFLEQTALHEQFAADVTHFASLQTLYKYVLETLNLITPHGLLSTTDYHYSREMLIDKGFIDYIEQHRHILKGLISLPTTAQLDRDPICFLGLLLTRMGLKQKRVGRSEKGTYHLDDERLTLLKSLMARRRAGLVGVNMPLDASAIPVKNITSLDILSTCIQGIKRFFSPNTDVFAGFCTT